jgi:hypothetical protein
MLGELTAQWLKMLRNAGQLKAVPRTAKNELPCVVADFEAAALETDDPVLIQKATTPAAASRSNS